MQTPPRYTFTVEIPVAGNVKERLQWVQNFFDFFHPSLNAKVLCEGQSVTQAEPEHDSSLD